MAIADADRLNLDFFRLTFRRVAFFFFDFDVKIFDQCFGYVGFYSTFHIDLHCKRPPRVREK